MVAAVMPKGLKVSIKFTPQAQDDVLSFTEDSGGAGYDYDTADLLANDLATGAARVWGIFEQSETDVQNNIGTLVLNNVANGDTSFAIGAVTVDYDYETGDITVSFDPAVFDYLAEGESAAVGSFTYVIRMSNGAFSTAVAKIEVTGENDGPVISAYTEGAVIEDSDAPTLSDTGTLTFDDADLSDTHTVTDGVADGGNALGGVLTAGITDVATGAGTGTVTWNYSVANSATQYLAQDETAVEKFKVTINDNHGGSVEQEIEVVVKGVNDEVTIVADLTDADGAVTEDASTPNLSDTGTIAFTDVDLADTHTASFVKETGTLGGSLTLGAVSEGLNAAGGSVGWTYVVANANVQYLAKDQTATETFTVKVNDLNGDTVDQTVSVTVKGVNDTPTDIALDNNSVAENLANEALVGILSTTDVDSIDTHAYSIVGGTGSALFAIDGNTIEVAGALNFEGESSYSLVIRTTDSNLAFYDKTVTINVTDLNETPVITSNGGGATAAISVPENNTAVTTVVAADPDLGGDNDLANNFENLTYSISGGADQLKFTLDPTTGVLAFLAAPNFEVPTDEGGDHIYNVEVTATDGSGLSDSQAIAVTVSDVSEGPLAAPPVFTGTGDPNDFDSLLASSAIPGPVSVTDGPGGNTIHGSNNGDTINAGNGNDSVYGHDGDDAIFGDGASDTSLYGQAGNDTLSGGQGGDTIYGGSGNDIIYGMQNPESASPPDGGDTIYGGSGNDTIYGQAGDDLIIGGYGADLLTGNGGADTFSFLSNNDTGDTITDFQVGSDKIDLQALFGGTLGSAPGTALAANSVNWYYDSGTNQTIVQVDDNNNTGNVDMQIYLMGNQALSAGDFLL